MGTNKQDKTVKINREILTSFILPLLFALYCGYLITKTDFTVKKMTERVLLPTNVVPSEYDIKLTPNFKDFTFSGNEDVKLKVVSPTDKIVLHSLDVKINGGKVLREGKAVASVSDVAYEKETERATLTLDTKLDAGDVVLQLEFVGELNDKMAGFYRSKYTTDDGEERYAATTQFEPTDARRAFPCWDEPALKAKFSITLTVPKDRVALSNMPGKVVSSDDSTQTYAFEQTPIMSTYLVAFVVGEFDYVETTTKKNVLMRVYTPVGKKEQGQFALDCGAKILDYYDDYFGVAYPLPKLDMIAIADFSAGAMENWGLVTYRSTAVLIDEKNSGLSSRQRVAYVVAHELAHQWFGNLVTMEWWKELWLNEGFATFVGNQATDFLFPDWDIWTSFQSDYTNRALQSDALESSHPIEVDVASSSQVNEIFDAISYCKGAAVIRMIADHVGEDAMKKGLNAYINKHAYNNAVTTDLWEALSAASGKDVAAFMSRWTQKMGYPCVKVSLVDGEYKIEQARFLASGAKGDDDGQWHLSLRVVAEGGAKHTITTSQKETKVQLPPALNNAKWVKFNAGQPGFFRVAYSDGLLAQLAAGVSTQEIAPVDRLAVQADAFALAIAGHMKTSAALNLALSYQNETVYSVWSDLTASIGTVASVWQDDPAAPGISALRRKLYAPLGARLGWVAKEGEPPLDALLRAVALAQLVKANHTETVAEARRQFDLWATSIESGQEQENALAVDLRHTISMAAVRYGDEKDWERVQALYRKVEMQEEKIRLMRALAATKDEKLVKRTFEWGLSDDVRNQDLFYVVGTLAAVNRDQTWELFKTNWDEFYKRFGEGQFLLARIVGQVTGGFVTTERADEVEAFFNEHKCDAAARTIKQSLEAIRSNAAWLQRDRAGVAKWLSDEGLLEGFVGGVH